MFVVLGLLIIPLFSDNFGRIKVLNISWFLCSISLFLIPFFDNYNMFLLLISLACGLSNGCISI